MDGVLLVGSCFSSEPVESKDVSSASGVARIWESAQFNEYNAAHWKHVSDTPINEDLTQDLETLQNRSRYEATNNPLIEAAIETHATDICGDCGPSLQSVTGKTKYDKKIEQLWEDWVANCEYQHGLALVDLLEGWVGQLWYHGEFLAQDVIGQSAMDYKLLDLGADRLDSSFNAGNVVMGIEVNKSGQPIAYHVTDPGSAFTRSALKRSTKRVPINLITHGFRRRFAGQLRGFPLIASGLETNAELRDYETQVMDAARAAADQAIWFVADHPDAAFTQWNENARWTWGRRQARQAAPGWKPVQMDSRQPAAQYKDYRKEKERDVVIASQMPLMILRKDSSEHNLSSARYDGVRYTKSITRLQSWFNRRILTYSLQRLIALAKLDGTLKIDPPRNRNVLVWSWPKPPSNDPVKDRMAERLGLENGTLTFTDALGNNGLRTDRVIAQRNRDNADLAAAGLPVIYGAVPTTYQPAPLPWIDDPNGDAADNTNAPNPDDTASV